LLVTPALKSERWNAPKFWGANDISAKGLPAEACIADMGVVHSGKIDDMNLDSSSQLPGGPAHISREWSRLRLISRLYSVECNATSSTAAPELGLVADLPPGFNLRASRQETAFAMTVRRRKVNKHRSFRPIQLVYFLTRLHDFPSAITSNQNNLRHNLWRSPIVRSFDNAARPFREGQRLSSPHQL
jgi:hypothetical protein